MTFTDLRPDNVIVVNCGTLRTIRTVPSAISCRRLFQTKFVIGCRTSLTDDEIPSFEALKAVVHVNLFMTLFIFSSLNEIYDISKLMGTYVEVLWTNDMATSDKSTSCRHTFIVFVFLVFSTEVIGDWTSNAFEHFPLESIKNGQRKG